MSHSNLDDEARRSGLAGSLKFVAMLTIAALALLAGLVVLEAVAPERFAQMSSKIVALAAIAALAIVVIAALLRAGKRGSGTQA